MPEPASTYLFAGAAVFAAALVHAVAGFGAALVAMPLLAAVLSVRVVSPAVALLTLTLNLMLLWRVREEFAPGGIAPLVAGAAVGIPIGVLFLSRAGERAMTVALGTVLVLYALVSLARTRPIPLARGGGVAMGLLSGALGGAFNAGGPPAVVYLSSREWRKGEIYASLQLYFALIGLLIVISHALAGLTTPEVLRLYALCLPFLATGSAAGYALHRRTEPRLYRRLVFGLLLLLGAFMIAR